MGRNVLITGGAGFIGSWVVEHFVRQHPDYNVVVLDKLTECGSFENLDVAFNSPNLHFVQGDVVDYPLVKSLLHRYKVDSLIHLGYETHVARSIDKPFDFMQTNVGGMLSLLMACRKYWGSDTADKLFYHISSYSVYGSIAAPDRFTEESPYNPCTPYAASMASSEHFANSFRETYGLPVIISHLANTYGPRQFQKRLIPMIVEKILLCEPIELHAEGDNIRDWVYVEDVASGIDAVFHQGKVGEIYNIASQSETTTIELVRKLVEMVAQIVGMDPALTKISFMGDVSKHDRRYAMDCSKIARDLNWCSLTSLDDGLRKSVQWYVDELKEKRDI